MTTERLPTMEEAQRMIAQECDALKTMLLAKNASYGNSVFQPPILFCEATAVQRIHARIEDKLCRIRNGHEFTGDDTLHDLNGYLIILRVAKRFAAEGFKP